VVRFKKLGKLEQSQLGLNDIRTKMRKCYSSSYRFIIRIESQLEKQGVKLVSNLVRNTVEGERYIQASRLVAFTYRANNSSLKRKPEDLKWRLGNRFLLIPEPPNINNTPS
jgi:hypothetical protein